MAQGKRPSFSRTTEIDAPLERVFEYYANIENQVEIWPSLVDVRNVQRDASGHPTHFEWSYKMAGFKLDGTGEYTEFEPNRSFANVTKGGINSFIRATFEERGGKTLLHEAVEFEIPIPLVGRFAEQFLKRINENELAVIHANLKARMEAPA